MSYISVGTTTTTALIQGADTTGNLVIATGSGNTTALTITNTQNATFAGNVSVAGTITYTSGTPVASPALTINSQQNYGGF
jgi:hypothetical protein